MDKTPDKKEVIKRLFKYLILWIAVTIAAKLIPTSCRLSIKETTMVGVVGAVTFALLDMYAPAVYQKQDDNFSPSVGVKKLHNR